MNLNIRLKPLPQGSKIKACKMISWGSYCIRHRFRTTYSRKSKNSKCVGCVLFCPQTFIYYPMFFNIIGKLSFHLIARLNPIWHLGKYRGCYRQLFIILNFVHSQKQKKDIADPIKAISSVTIARICFYFNLILICRAYFVQRLLDYLARF